MNEKFLRDQYSHLTRVLVARDFFLKVINNMIKKGIIFSIIVVGLLVTFLVSCASCTKDSEDEPQKLPKEKHDYTYGIIPLSNEVFSSNLKNKIGDVDSQLNNYLNKMDITTHVVKTQPITYQAVESPKMTLDPEYGEPVKEKLQTILRQQKNWQGLIFGHIREDWSDDKLYVIVRVYHPGCQTEGYKSFGHQSGLELEKVSQESVRGLLTKIVPSLGNWIMTVECASPSQSQPQLEEPQNSPKPENDFVDPLQSNTL